jgi:hypothetical protein
MMKSGMELRRLEGDYKAMVVQIIDIILINMICYAPRRCW